MYTSLPEQPLGILDLTGLAFRFWRRNLGALLRFLLVPSIVATPISIAVEWLMTVLMAGATNGGPGLTPNLILPGAGIAVAWLLVWWWMGIRLLAICRLLLGISSTLDEARVEMAKRKWPIAGLFFLLVGFVLVVSGFWLVLMLSGFAFGGAVRVMVLVVTGLIGFIGLLGTLAFYSGLSNIAYCVLACEGPSVRTAFTRGIKLVSKYFVRTVVFCLASLVILSVIGVPFSIPITVLRFVDMGQHGLFSGELSPSYTPPLYVLAVSATWESLIGMLVRPLVICIWAYYYLDLRMRYEGFDLQRKLSGVSKARFSA